MTPITVDAMNLISNEAVLIYFFIGILGATIANTTGAGGGIVFIPFFSYLGMTNILAVSTSIGIQCLGMTAGSISWTINLRNEFLKLIKTALLCSLFALLGMLLVYLLDKPASGYLNLLFGLLSIFVAITSKLAIKLDNYSPQDQSQIFRLNKFMLLAAFVGGIFTYYVSIGVGELLLIAAALSGYSLKNSIALAVVTTSLTVSPSLFIFSFYKNISLELLIPIGIGAIIGGILSNKTAQLIGIRRVKSLCIFVIGLTGIIEISVWGMS